jgi:hypothetical protein
MKARKRTLIISAVFLIAFLALASYITGQRIWDGGWPSAKVRLVVTNETGEAIKNARFTVYSVHDGKRGEDYYPIENASRITDGFVTGPDGGIEFNVEDGLSYGGTTWMLFWCIPIELEGGKPDVRCEITADGFKPIEFTFDSLFENTPPDAKEKLKKDIRPTYETIHRLRR